MSAIHRIDLGNGVHALIDACDVELVSGYRWSLLETRGKRYARTSVRRGSKRVTIYLHRLIMNAPPGVLVDHEDGNGLHCRRANMRLATHQQNAWNSRRPKSSTSRYKGVTYDAGRCPKRPWRAKLTINRRTLHIGYFASPEAAARAYDERARELFGEFARVNFR